MTDKQTEQDICRWAVDWIASHEFEVYQEVEALGGRCDIVGTKGKVLLACEAKLGPSLKLLGQALNWIKGSNLTWVATNPTRKGGLSYQKTDRASRQAFEAFLTDHGIGWIELDRGTVQVKLDASLRRSRDDSLSRHLHQIQKTLVSAGGNRSGVAAATITEHLGNPKGRGVPPAIAAWAIRVGLVADEDEQVVRPVKIGRQRAWQLAPRHLAAARAKIGGKA